MRRLHTKLTAAVLAFALPLAMTSVAGAAPALKLSGHRPAGIKTEAAGLSLAVVPGATTLQPSGFEDTLPAWIFDENDPQLPTPNVYHVSLNAGEVLHAVITQDVDADAFEPELDCVAVEGSVNNIWEDQFVPIAYSTGVQRQEIFVPAANGTGLYQLAFVNWSEIASTYTVEYEILTGRTPATATRLDGATRYDVAEKAARKAFPGWAGVKDVIIASGDDRAMADPLAASSLAGAYGAPLLLVKPLLVNSKLPAPTERVINEIKIANGGKVNIHVIGGTATVPAAVYNRVSALKGTGGTIERISGADRYSLSATIAKKARDVIVANGGTVTDVLIANGESPAAFYDALAISPIAYRNGFPMMLSRGTSVPSAVRGQLNTTFASANRYLVNSETYLNEDVLDVTGAEYNIVWSENRYDAAWDIADWAYRNDLLPRDSVAVANKLPDALTGGVAMGEIGAPILYTPANGLPDATVDLLYNSRGAFTKAYVLGGTLSVTGGTLSSINGTLDW